MLRFAFVIALLAAAVQGEEPWSASAAHPIPRAAPRRSTADPAPSTAATVAAGWLTFYQRTLSVLMQSQCRMEPSCSAYSRQAIEKHGALIGIVMTTDRLLHEGDEQALNRTVRKAGVAFCPDPVSNNDFWWYRP